MTWTVIVKHGSNTNLTLSSIYYDKWGAKTQQQVILCNTWEEGYAQAK